ncbi:MAG TPA: nuclear transport factor 2 family protein [Candidatus Binataceae bacterium]|nr:nuclear transport factor 2 family protein [Candidatus Binataceae bacterium]
MKDESTALAADREFFAALAEGDAETLDRILADDFTLIEVMRGAEVPKAAMLALIRSGRLSFEPVESAETRARLYGSAAVITGRTEMRGRVEQTPFAVRSRYTHVYIRQHGRWRLVAAQGTQIAS